MKYIRRLFWSLLILLTLATSALWIRSYYSVDAIYNFPGNQMSYMVYTSQGYLVCRYARDESYAKPDWRYYHIKFDKCCGNIYCEDLLPASDASPRNYGLFRIATVGEFLARDVPGMMALGLAWGTAIEIPIWIILFALSLPLLGAFITKIIRRKKHAGNLCPTCSYDLRAHKTGDNCPECGAPIPQTS